MSTASALYALLTAFSTALCLGLALVGWRRRASPGGVFFGLTMLAGAWWSFTSSLEAFHWDIATEIAISQVAYLGKMGVPVFFLLFALEYTGLLRASYYRYTALLALAPGLINLVVWTNGWHHLFWTKVYPQQAITGSIYIYEHGPWFWAAAAHNHLLSLTAVAIISRHALLSIRMYRQQALALLLGIVVTVGANLLYILRLTPLPGLDPSPIAGALTGLIFALGIFKFHLLDILPVARDILVEQMEEGLITLDRSGRIVDLNPAARRLLELREEIVGKSAPEVLPDWVNWREPIKAEQKLHVSLGAKEGGPSSLEVILSPLNSAQGHRLGLMVVLRDESERLKVEKLRDDLVRTIVHDLRNPLNSIMLSISMIERGGENTADQEILTVARNASHKMLNLVNTILEIHRLESGQMPLACAAINAVGAIDAALRSQAPQAQSHRVNLVNASGDKPVWVYADPTILQRILQNLLGNALAHTPEGGQIEAFAQPDDNHKVTIFVRDSGYGIAAEILPRLFQMFATSGRGSGIGLAFCRLAVEAHGGRIWAENRPEGGALFGFTLPTPNSISGAGDPAD